MTYTEFCLTVVTTCAALCTAAYWVAAEARRKLDAYRLNRLIEQERQEAERNEKGFE
jgi:hypothetical protein